MPQVPADQLTAAPTPCPDGWTSADLGSIALDATGVASRVMPVGLHVVAQEAVSLPVGLATREPMGVAASICVLAGEVSLRVEGEHAREPLLLIRLAPGLARVQSRQGTYQTGSDSPAGAWWTVRADRSATDGKAEVWFDGAYTLRIPLAPKLPGQASVWLDFAAGTEAVVGDVRVAPGEIWVRPPLGCQGRAEVLPGIRLSVGAESVTVSNAGFELTIGAPDQPTRLVHRPTGVVLADQPYRYGPDTGTASGGRPEVEQTSYGSVTVRRHVEAGPLQILHTITFLRGSTFEETLKVTNAGTEPVPGAALRMGFARSVGSPEDPLSSWRFTNIPLRRDAAGTRGATDEEFSPVEVARDLCWYRTHWPSWGHVVWDGLYGSDGWALWDEGSCVTVIKYTQDHLEYSLLDGEPYGPMPARPAHTDGSDKMQVPVVRFGGCGVLHGDPEAAANLAPGETVTFGTTTFIETPGDWKQGYYAFRDFMAARGHDVPAGFNPPVHWNELYDNPLWWGPDTAERRAAHYRLEDMRIEAEKAREVGAEALYLDPGWDTKFASTIWAADRLGPLDEFVRTMRDEYGLAVSLHCPLAGWTDATDYPRDMDRVGSDGSPIVESLCGASSQYLEEKARRLLELAEQGVVYFMFDGSVWTGECWATHHGHSVPSTREEQIRAYAELCCRVRERFPELIIEQHDPVVAGTPYYYVPKYYLHEPSTHTELWGYELMWDPWDDLVSGRALALYYHQLAYGLPMYLHISLKRDNEDAIVFWWNASTCRHLGIGGKNEDPAVWEAHKRAMQDYLRLKQFFTQGEFRGIEPGLHAHVLPAGVVLNVFNLADTATTLERTIPLEELGPRAPTGLRSADPRAAVDSASLRLSVPLGPWGHTLIELRA